MSNLESLKQELITQKAEIESKGGSVSVANTNPSPSEITAGIKTIAVANLTDASATIEDVASGKTFYSGDNVLKTGIKEFADFTLADAKTEDVATGKTFYAGNGFLKTGTKVIPDVTNATATASDVISGKTFYSGDNNLKTGTLITDAEKVNKDLDWYYNIFVTTDGDITDSYDFVMREGTKVLKQRAFYGCSTRKVNLTFNPELEEIGTYCFYEATGVNFVNFLQIPSLRTIGDYAFNKLKGISLPFGQLPDNLVKIGPRAFSESVAGSVDIKFAKTLESVGAYAFSVLQKTEMKKLIIPEDNSLTSLGSYMINNLVFDCDFSVPKGITDIQTTAIFGTSFNNITIHAGVKSMGNAAFYLYTTDAVSSRRLKTVTFEGETPPTVGTYTFADQDKTNKFKIYVPDNAVDEYKDRFDGFEEYIYPVSQKD